MFKILTISLLALGLCACSTHQTPERNVASESLLENQIDPKFEEFEDGTFQAEAAVHQKLIKFSFDLMKNMYEAPPRKPQRPMTRDAHAKSHGCLKASFEVDNSILPEAGRVGLFSENKEYSAWVRFSNNDHLPMRKDNEFDLRGMAIKVMGVEGPKIMSGYENAPTQDFLMYGSDVFFIKDNKDYVGFIKGLRDGNAVKVLLTEQFTAGFNTLGAQWRMKNFINPLNPKYFSAVPMRMGLQSDPSRTAVKYRVQRCETEFHEAPFGKKNHNYMRMNLKDTLGQKSACYNFQLQFQTDQVSAPVEDSTERWRGSYITVAKVEIPMQDFDTPERDSYCENLSFTPWHSLIEHKPLGRTMRMRRDLYKATSGYRGATNRAKLDEPSGFDID